MLELNVDVIPFGDESKRRTIGKMIISNTGKNKNPKRSRNHPIIKITDWIT